MTQDTRTSCRKAGCVSLVDDCPDAKPGARNVFRAHRRNWTARSTIQRLFAKQQGNHAISEATIKQVIQWVVAAVHFALIQHIAHILQKGWNVGRLKNIAPEKHTGSS